MATLGGSSPSHYPIATIVWLTFSLLISLLILAKNFAALTSLSLSGPFIIRCYQTSFAFVDRLHAFAVPGRSLLLAFMTNASDIPRCQCLGIVTWRWIETIAAIACLAWKVGLRDVIMACEKLHGQGISHVSTFRGEQHVMVSRIVFPSLVVYRSSLHDVQTHMFAQLACVKNSSI
jgi:hypothetical protein